MFHQKEQLFHKEMTVSSDPRTGLQPIQFVLILPQEVKLGHLENVCVWMMERRLPLDVIISRN